MTAVHMVVGGLAEALALNLSVAACSKLSTLDSESGLFGLENHCRNQDVCELGKNNGFFYEKPDPYFFAFNAGGDSGKGGMAVPVFQPIP